MIKELEKQEQDYKSAAGKLFGKAVGMTPYSRIQKKLQVAKAAL
jgi:hypothetical protein